MKGGKMVGRVIVLKGYLPDKNRLHVYGCAIKDLDEEDKQNHRIKNLTVGLLMETRNDFRYEQQLIHGESDSYQVRPKALFKSNKGLFYKEDNKRVYISEEREQEVYKHIEYWKTPDWESIIE